MKGNNKYARKIARLEAKSAAATALVEAEQRMGIIHETPAEVAKRVVGRPAGAVGSLLVRGIGLVTQATGKAVGTVGSGLLYAADREHRQIVDAERLINLAHKQGVSIVVQAEASVSE